MKRNATIVECVLAVVALVLLFSVYLERHRGRDDAKLATLHTHTVVTKVIAAQAETSYTAAKLDAAAMRALYRSVRDSALRNLGDTALERRALAKADTAFVHDTVAIVRGDTAIQKEKDVATSTDAELHEALKSRYSPRLTATVAALYDPIHGQPLASAGVSVRVIGGLSLVGRIDQRAAIGERPSLAVGLALTF